MEVFWSQRRLLLFNEFWFSDSCADFRCAEFLEGGNSARVLVETNFEASKTRFLKAFRSLKNCLDKARLLKHNFPVHGSFVLFDCFPEISGAPFFAQTSGAVNLREAVG